MPHSESDTANGAQAPECPLSRLAEVVGQQISAAANTLPAQRVAILQARGRARDLEATAAALLAKLRE